MVFFHIPSLSLESRGTLIYKAIVELGAPVCVFIHPIPLFIHSLDIDLDLGEPGHEDSKTFPALQELTVEPQL